MTIDDLAGMVKRGVDGVDVRFNTLEQEMRTHFQHVSACLDTIRSDIADSDDLRERVAHLEDLLKVER